MDFDALLKEISFKASRSGGSGGQNVNKVSTKVELAFNVSESQILNDDEKQLILTKQKNRITNDGILLLTSQSERSQLGNKRKVIEKFREILNESFYIQKQRIPKSISKTMKLKRLEAKKKRSETKVNRKNIL